MAGLTDRQLDNIQLVERISSVLSVLGCLFVIATYLSFSPFHKPINRLVFYASFGNLFTNVATLISRSGIMVGVNSPLCQMQAFIIQLFMPADACWTLCMALNVYLTFFRRFSAQDLRRLEWKYALACYGIPSIPAFVFIFISSPGRGHIFGSAVLWCWITEDWNALRIAIFYGPVWIILLTTIVIYVVVGRVVYKNRKRFRKITESISASSASHESDTVVDTSDSAPGVSTKTTEIRITTSAASPANGDNRPFDNNAAEKQPYTVKIETAPERGENLSKAQRDALTSADRAAWAYMKCAALFFAALLLTWVPATLNRVATLVDPSLVSYGLNFTEALLLPLQGFWNAAIYITTSIPACRAFFQYLFPAPGTRPFVALQDLRPNPRGEANDAPTSNSGGAAKTLPQRPKKSMGREQTRSRDLNAEEVSIHEALARNAATPATGTPPTTGTHN